MTLCSLHPPRRHIESVYQRSYNWWLERTNDSMLITSYWISLSTFYNWWLGRTNDSMLITPNPDVKLNQFINVPIIDGWDAQMTLCSLHPPRRHVESVYQRCYNWWLERTNESMLILRHIESFINVRIIDGWNAQMTLCSLHPPRRHQFWISLSTFNVPIIDGWNAQMTLCSLHPPRRHIESVYQRSYNWWLERTNDSMLITPTQTSRWISLSTLL